MLSSVLRLRACSKVLGYPSVQKTKRNFDAQGCHDPGWGGATNLYGLYRCMQPQKVRCFSVLVIDWALTLAILVLNIVWFYYSSFESSMFLRSYFFIIINKVINESPSQLCVGNCANRNSNKYCINFLAMS